MAANNAVVMQAQNQMGVNVQSFQAKYNSKRECYNFLAWEVKARRTCPPTRRSRSTFSRT